MKKYEEVYQKIKEDILNERLKTGDSLPSIRESVNTFGVSQTTVEKAYEQLMLDGYIRSVDKVGFFVDMDAYHIRLHTQYRQPESAAEPKAVRYDFRTRLVSGSGFDAKIWKRYLKEVYTDSEAILSYGDEQGEPALRKALSEYAYRSRGVLCRLDQVLAGSNFQSLLFMVCSLFSKPCTVALEKHSSAQVFRVLSSMGFSIVLLEEEDFLSSIENNTIDLLYINSACFGKMHRPLSRDFQNRLTELCAQRHIVILEDDYNGELTYISKPRMALQGFSKTDNVIYFGSFSRLLLPSLRVSYCVLNQRLKEIYREHKNEFGPSASKFEQMALASYIENGHLEKRLRKLKKEYRIMAVHAKQVLSNCFESVRLNEAYLSFEVPVQISDEDRWYTLCENQGIATDKIHDGILELSFAHMDAQHFETGISLLVKCLKEC